ncbi:unnamed protein product [Rhizophagus irregularis]|nr:unnamed protein product [Rhizophagus irregularis]
MRFDHIKTRSKATAVSILSPFQIHSNLIHQRWKTKETKTIYSNRLGITYTSRYVNTKHKSNDRDGWQFMYNKRLENFNHINSTNTRTHTRQKSRFDRACRRIFNYDKSLRTDTKYHQRLSGQLRSRLDSIINKKRPPEPIHIPATIMLAPKKYLSDYKDFLYYIRSTDIISDTATPSPSTTPPHTPPPGARSIPILEDSDENVGLPLVTKRDSQTLSTTVKRTKTSHPLSLPQKRVPTFFPMAKPTTDTKKTKF